MTYYYNQPPQGPPYGPPPGLPPHGTGPQMPPAAPYQGPPPPQAYYGPPPQAQVVPTSGTAVAALILAIISVFGGFLLVVPPLAAILLGHAATGQTKRGLRGGHGMAIAALIIGYLTAVPGVILVIAWLAPA